jgi:HD-like signal output (HDOD) protein
MGSVDRFFANGAALPMMPEVARRLLDSFEDERADLRQIVELAEQDQALCGKIIKLANCAHYGVRQPVASLRQAAVLLGLETMRNLMLSSTMVDAFPDTAGLDRIRFWRHCVATGGYTRWLGRSVGIDSDSSYLAGFLLRSGQVLMAMQMPEAVRAIEQECVRPGLRMKIEQLKLGSSHPQVTAELARRWELPRPLIDAFRHAPEPLGASPFSLLAAVLNLAAITADAGDLGSDQPAYWCESEPHVLEHLRLDPAWLQVNLPSYESMTYSVEALTG